MFELRCTVRRCPELLHRREDGLRCTAGHHFDQAKEGYWNLLQPQDKRSLKPGDADTAVLARHRWLARGHADGLIETLRPWVAMSSSTDQPATVFNQLPRTLDLGCGEGSFGPALFPADADGYCGIDLSKRAIKLAARGWPEATWILANADRVLPAADSSVHRVVSLFGRRPAAEISRVLVSGGICIIAVPGEDDLIELREHVQQSGRRRSRWETVVEEMSSAGLDCLEQKHWRFRVKLDPGAIADALAMTYRAGRRSEKIRRDSLSTMHVTLATDLILFRRKPLDVQ